MRSAAVLLMLLLLLVPVCVHTEEPAEEPATEDASGDVVHYEHGRVTVRATDAPLDRLLRDIANQTGATMWGNPPSRTVSFDMHDVPLADALQRMMGADSFMLTYGTDGRVRTIRFLGRGEAVVYASPAPSPAAAEAAAPAAPLAEEEKQAAVLQKQVVVQDYPPLRRALGTTLPSIGEVLHATTVNANPNVRSGAREVALATFASDPAVEAAYLSTLEPVDDATLAKMLSSASSPGAAAEWMGVLSTRASSPALRAKASAVLTHLRQ
jgi:hypothetical protein